MADEVYVDPKMITAPEEGWAEGPCGVKVGGKTRLYYAPPDDFGAYESTDMKNWTNIRKEMVPPGGYREKTYFERGTRGTMIVEEREPNNETQDIQHVTDRSRTSGISIPHVLWRRGVIN